LNVRQVQDVLELDDPFALEREAIEAESSDNLGWRKAQSPIRSASNIVSNTNVSYSNGNSAPPVSSATAATNTWDQTSLPPLDIPRQTYTPFDGTMAQDAIVAPTVGNEPMSNRLRKIDLQLASEIIKPAELWNLGGLSNQLVEIQATAQNDAERIHAQKLINKLDRLRQTHQSLMNTHLSNPTSRPVSTETSTGSATIGTGVEKNLQLGSTYDAYGWLNELVQNSGRDQPTYVLQDDEGKILYHLEPAPGLNLRRYLHTKVGVIGSRGFNQRLKLKHVTVDRLVVLDRGNTNLR
jgi:hypothetical protein